MTLSDAELRAIERQPNPESDIPRLIATVRRLRVALVAIQALSSGAAELVEAQRLAEEALGPHHPS